MNAPAQVVVGNNCVANRLKITTISPQIIAYICMQVWFFPLQSRLYNLSYDYLRLDSHCHPLTCGVIETGNSTIKYSSKGSWNFSNMAVTIMSGPQPLSSGGTSKSFHLDHRSC